MSATVEAAPNFLANLDAAHRFFLLQDEDTADVRFAGLKAAPAEMEDILAWSPASGRPARFLATCSAQGALRLAAIQQLAEPAR